MEITKKASMGGYIGQKEKRESGNFLDAINNVETLTKRQTEAKEQVYRIKLNRAERERLIAAIKVRKTILRTGDTQRMGTSREEQINTAQQTRQEAKVITQNISTEMTGSPLVTLVARILGKLPENAYKYLSATVILSMALSACSAINRSKEFEAGQAALPAAIAVVPDFVSDDEAVVEVPPSVSPTETAQPMDPVEDLLSRYLTGEDIDVNSLTQAEFIEFSAKLADKKNEARGINPIIYNNEKYIDPSDYKLKDYDGHPDMNETIQMFVPIAGKDEQGNLQFMANRQLVTIAGSADVDWNMVISDPNDTRIDWPKTKPMKASGIPEVQDKIDYFGMVLNPMVFLDKKVGELKLYGSVGQNLAPLSTLPFYDIETDAAGNPVLARMILTLGLDYNLFEEGGTLDAQSFDGQLPENSYVYQGLQANAVYYVGLNPKQKKTYEDFGYSLDGYRGVADGNKVQELITGQETNDKDMIVTFVSLLIRKTTNTAK